MYHIADLCNHKAHSWKKYYLPPVTEAKRDIWDISLLTDFFKIKDYFINKLEKYSKIGEEIKD